MPRIYRGMKEKGGLPMLGSSGTSLGVRLPDAAHPEIKPDLVPDSNGEVHPGSGGMSVSPSIATLPPHTIPRRLQPYYRDAAGKDTLRVWRLGDGSFVDGPLSDGLALRVDPTKVTHGYVEPAQSIRVNEYVAAVHRTREQWVDAETECS